MFYDTYSPLSGSEQAKIMLFFLFILILSLMFVGVPVLLLALIGLGITKKSSDFSAMNLIIKIIKFYTHAILPFIFIIITGIFFYVAIDSYNGDKNCIPSEITYCSSYDTSSFLNYLLDWNNNELIGGIIIIFLYFLSIFLINFLFFKPLLKHRDWIAENGIFNNSKNFSEHEPRIIKTDMMKSYSVADELNKWATLRENGHISEEEFQKIKSKILSG